MICCKQWQDRAVGAWQHIGGANRKHKLARMQTVGGRVRDGGSIVDAQVPVEGVEDALQGHSRAGGAAQEVLLNSQPGRGGAWVDVCLGDMALDLLQRVFCMSAFHSIVNQRSLLCKLLGRCIGRLTASPTAAFAAATYTAAATFEMQHHDCVQGLMDIQRGLVRHQTPLVIHPPKLSEVLANRARACMSMQSALR